MFLEWVESTVSSSRYSAVVWMQIKYSRLMHYAAYQQAICYHAVRVFYLKIQEALTPPNHTASLLFTPSQEVEPRHAAGAENTHTHQSPIRHIPGGNAEASFLGRTRRDALRSPTPQTGWGSGLESGKPVRSRRERMRGSELLDLSWWRLTASRGWCSARAPSRKPDHPPVESPQRGVKGRRRFAAHVRVSKKCFLQNNIVQEEEKLVQKRSHFSWSQQHQGHNNDWGRQGHEQDVYFFHIWFHFSHKDTIHSGGKNWLKYVLTFSTRSRGICTQQPRWNNKHKQKNRVFLSWDSWPQYRSI